MIQPSVRIVRCQDVIFADMGGEVALLHTKNGVYYTLNAVAATVWSELRKATSVRDLQARVMAEYQVEIGQCERDLAELLAQLLEEHLIEITS